MKFLKVVMVMLMWVVLNLLATDGVIETVSNIFRRK